MDNFEESKNRFQLSERKPREYPVRSNEDAVCVDIADALGESDMRYILARKHQLGISAVELAYSVVKDEMRKGNCRNPRRLFNFLLTKELRKQQDNS